MYIMIVTMDIQCISNGRMFINKLLVLRFSPNILYAPSIVEKWKFRRTNNIKTIEYFPFSATMTNNNYFVGLIKLSTIIS